MPVAPSSALAETQEQKPVEVPEYSQEERYYLAGLQVRLESARTQRQQAWPLLDGLTYEQYWWANERGANTLADPNMNREDVQFQSGTTRNKLFTFLAQLVNLDLGPDVTAFDEHEMEIARFGEIAEDAMEKCAETENDDEKKVRRQYELLKHGDVFVEEIWDDLYIKDKNLQGSKTFDGTVQGVSWTTKLKRYFSGPRRNIVCGLNVYLGDMRIYDIAEQPFLFTVEVIPYATAEARFGKWERWKYVRKDASYFNANTQASMAENTWRFSPEMEKGHVEVLRYQDKWNNELAVILNGVLMTPVGLPMPWGYPEYNIAQQGLEPLSEKFAYHGSLVRRIRGNVALYDELAKVLTLKGQKSLVPPRFNNTGRLVSRRVFLPGALTAGLNPSDLPPADDREIRIDASEFQLLKFHMDTIDKQTVSPVFSGQDPAGDPTATQVLEVQRQAKQLIGLTVFAAARLEWKLAWLRLPNLLLNWFKPKGTKAVGNEVVDEYRVTNVARPIEGAGMGRRVTIPTKTLPTPDEVKNLEDQMEQSTGTPHRFTFINPDRIMDARLTWQIAVIPKEKRTSELSKLLFRNMLGGVAELAQLGAVPNVETLAERFATAWDEDPTKLFSKAGLAVPQLPGQEPAAGGAPQLPKPEDVLNRSLANAVRS